MCVKIFLEIFVNLFKTAQESGVSNLGKFNNYGYRGLYNGETANDIRKRKIHTKQRIHSKNI